MQVPYPNEMVQFKYIGERIRKLCVYILQLKWFRQKEIPSYSWCVWLFVLLDLQIDTWIHLHLRGQCLLLSLLIKTLILKLKTPHRHAQSNVWPNVWEFDSSVKISSEKYTFFFLLCGACLLILCNSQCSRHLCLLIRRMLQGYTCQKNANVTCVFLRLTGHYNR